MCANQHNQKTCDAAPEARLAALTRRLAAVEATLRGAPASEDDASPEAVVARLEATAREVKSRDCEILGVAFDMLPMPVGIILPTREFLLINRAARAFFGDLPPEEWLQLPLLDAVTRQPVSPDWRIGACAARGAVVCAFEALIVFPDGRETPVLLNAGPICRHGELVATVVALQDITALKESDLAKDRFLTVLSHELLTPLTSILGWAQAAYAAHDLGIIRQALAIVISNSQRQQRLLTDLLMVSELLYGKVALALAPADLWELACHEMDDLGETAGVTMERCPPDAPLPILADVPHLRQAIGHLLANAVKYANGRITVTAGREDGQAVLAVRDNGRGIPADVLPTLFTPFVQPERGNTSEGLGLGLALVKGVVNLHGGRVTAASPGPGHGSTFTIALPLAHLTPNPVPAREGE